MKRSLPFAVLLFANAYAIAQPKYHSAYSELGNPKKANVRAWARATKPLYASFASKDASYPKEVAPNFPKEVSFWGETCWRGERVSAVLLLWSGTGVNDVKVQISDLETARGQKIKAENCTVGFVRYVMSDTYKDNGCAPRRARDFDSTLVADVIERRPSVSIKEKTVQPVWLTFNVPAETPSGKYKGFVTITAKEAGESITLTTNIFVREHVLPAAADRSFVLDLWQNPYAVARCHNVAPWSKAHLDAMRPVMELLAQCGQKNITVPVANDVFDEPMQSEFRSMLTITKRVDNTWSIDFTKFDMWVEFMLELGIDREISCHMSGAPTQSLVYFDQAEDALKTVDVQHDSKESGEYLRTLVELLSEHLKEKGWHNKAAICVKESGKERLRRVANAAAKADSALRFCYLGNYFPDVDGSVERYSVAQLQPALSAKQKAARAQEGKTTSFYQPCSDAQPNTYLFSPAAEAAWIGWYAAANGFDGYTRQTFNSWGKNPLQDARGARYPAGYAALVYPEGRTSVRLERLIEGIQDFEKVKILQRQFEQTNNVVMRERLQRVLSSFKLENLQKSSAGEIVDEARIMLNSL